jgi:ABC-type sugar transport system ATPase subunit
MSRTTPCEEALRMEGISKAFPGTLAVDNVDFDVRAGEVHALVGENGAGKSTLMKLLAGSFCDYTGKVYIRGNEVTLHTPAQSKARGVGMIYQELSLARPISIAENLLVGKLPKKGVFIDHKEVRRRSAELLEQVGLSGLDASMPVSDISQCEAQLVEIAKTLGDSPRILVMDEPTSALSNEEVKRLFAIIRRLKAQGIAIVYISHHLQEVFEVADRITVMRDGKKRGTYNRRETSREEIVDLMVGRSVSEFYSRRNPTIGKEILRVDRLSRWGFFHDVSFSVREGETLAICGLAGAGRTELARAIVGVDRYDEGAVYLRGQPVRFRNMFEAIQSGVAYLTESRKQDGLAVRLTAAENTLSARIPAFAKGLLYNPRMGAEQVRELMEALSVYPMEPGRPTTNFSGGNQQKVLMAKWLMTRPSVLILDEPTRGVDIGAKEIIHRAVENLTAHGSAIILITSDLPEMTGLSDRAIILRNGHVIGEIEREEINESALLLAANGEGKHVHA